MLDVEVFSRACKKAVLFCLEKQVAKKPTSDEYDVMYLCPVCTSGLWHEQNYCACCGQKIKWE